uniref:SET domain-containing protein n=1 Tax=Pyrodinium bahamense TaxID=73915 RepID=A0A7R9ZZH6_9DINO
MHNAVAAAAACLRLCPPLKIAAKAAHRLALALALLGELGVAGEVLAAAPTPEAAGDAAEQCTSLAGQVESLREREDTGYSASDVLGTAAASMACSVGGIADAAVPTAESLGPIEAPAPRCVVVASRDIAVGEVVLVQRPIKGLAFGAQSLTEAASSAASLRTSSEGLCRRLAFASQTDVACARALELLGSARAPSLLGFEPPLPADVLGSLLQRLHPRLLPLLGQRSEFVPVAERLPMPKLLIEALVGGRQAAPTPGWRALIEAASRGEPAFGRVLDGSPAAVGGGLQGRGTGLYPAVALLGRVSSSLSNCALAPVGSKAIGALAVFTTQAVPRGKELLLAEAG